MLSYIEYKLITSIPLSSSIYELWKNIMGSTKGRYDLAYSNIYNLAKKFERMNIIKIDQTMSNDRKISRIQIGENYPFFKSLCDNFFQQYFSRATEILTEQIESTAEKYKLKYQIIGGQLDSTRAYADIQIAIPEEDAASWKPALKDIEKELNFFGITTIPKKQNRYLIRKLQVIPLPFKNINNEIGERLQLQTIHDIHYKEGFADLRPYFLQMLIGSRNG